MTADNSPARLSPLQLDTIDRLKRPDGDGWEPDPTLVGTLRKELETRLAAILDRTTEIEQESRARIRVTKWLLTQIHQCERRFLGTRHTPFQWSAPVARGSVAHAAIVYHHHVRGHRPPELCVDDALQRLAGNGDDLGEFLRLADELTLAEIRNEAVNMVVRYAESFPPFEARWAPVFEVPTRVPLCDGRVILSATPDIALGMARDRVATRVLIDLKTGSRRPEHVADLRFYALAETLRSRVPPRLVASAYLNEGHLATESVTEDLLWSTVDRVVDGVERLSALETGERPATAAPSAACSWCPLLTDCDEGRTFLDQ